MERCTAVADHALNVALHGHPSHSSENAKVQLVKYAQPLPKTLWQGVKR